VSTRPPVHRPPPRPGPVGITFNLTMAIIASFIMSIVIGCVIEWVGMHTIWKAEGITHSRDMVREDLGYLREYRRSLMTQDTVAFAARWADGIASVARMSGLLTLLERAHQPATSGAPRNGVAQATANIVEGMAPYIESGIYVAQDAAIRLAIVVLALPAFLLAVMVGLVDGLARRDVRRWGGGRESAFLYHGAKRLIKPAFTGGFTLYLTWPTGGFNPAWMVLPFCIAVAWVLSLMAATFKKYL
jgi:integrating conjugative element membrane protein (TIGR03747 family)